MIFSGVAAPAIHARLILVDTSIWIERALSRLPHAIVATDSKVLHFIDSHASFRRGAGYVDIHLLAAVKLTGGAKLWTRDKRLHGIAVQLGLARTPI